MNNIRIPWWIKLSIKIVLSKLPVNYSIWKKLGLFQHGSMEAPEYAEQVFLRHFNRFKKSKYFVEKYRVLELGPGDTLYTALIAKAFGASSSVMVDAVDVANKDIDLYQQFASYMKIKGYKLMDIDRHILFDKMLASLNAEYYHNGLSDLKSIKSSSVDFIFSHAVLEHVRVDEFDDHFKEMFRVLKPNGFMSHRVDFKDHLGGSLNNLRFTTKTWESSLFWNSGFYTNRLRALDLYNSLQNSGFESTILQEDRWDNMPLERNRLSKEFDKYTDDQLLISGIDVISVKRKPQ